LGILGSQILEKEGHASKRPLRETMLDASDRTIEELDHDCVQHGIVALDPRDRLIDHLAGAHLAASYEVGEADGVIIGILGEPHRAKSIRGVFRREHARSRRK
jgi:hypothetical protein